MKKRFRFLGLYLSILILLTGCYDYKVEMTVNKDKSVDFSMSLDIDMSSMADQFEDENDEEDNINIHDEMDIGSTTGFDDETLKRLESRGYTAKTEEDGYKYGVSISRKFDNIDDISSDEEIKVNLDEITEESFKDVFFTAKKGLFKTTYSAYFVFDMETEEVDMALYADQFNVSYKVNLPSKSDKNNATSEEDNTLIWNMEFGKTNEVIYEFSMINITSIIILISIVVVAIAVVILIIFNKKIRRR